MKTTPGQDNNKTWKTFRFTMCGSRLKALENPTIGRKTNKTRYGSMPCQSLKPREKSGHIGVVLSKTPTTAPQTSKAALYGTSFHLFNKDRHTKPKQMHNMIKNAAAVASPIFSGWCGGKGKGWLTLIYRPSHTWQPRAQHTSTHQPDQIVSLHQKVLLPPSDRYAAMHDGLVGLAARQVELRSPSRHQQVALCAQL